MLPNLSNIKPSNSRSHASPGVSSGLERDKACVHMTPVHVWSSRVQFFVTLWTVAHRAPLSMGFFKQEYLWVAVSSSCGSSPPSEQTCIFCVSFIGRWILYH